MEMKKALGEAQEKVEALEKQLRDCSAEGPFSQGAMTTLYTASAMRIGTVRKKS